MAERYYIKNYKNIININYKNYRKNVRITKDGNLHIFLHLVSARLEEYSGMN